MMVTWVFCAIYLWVAMHPGKRILHVCKKEGGADANLERIWYIYTHLPDQFKPKAERKNALITFRHKDGDSFIMAAAQTASDPRQFTFSHVWIDEMAFTPDAQEVTSAATPTIQGGGRFLGTSSPNGRDFMFQLVSDNGRIPFHKISRPFSGEDRGANLSLEDGPQVVDLSVLQAAVDATVDTPDEGPVLEPVPAPTNYPPEGRTKPVTVA